MGRASQTCRRRRNAHCRHHRPDYRAGGKASYGPLMACELVTIDTSERIRWYWMALLCPPTPRHYRPGAHRVLPGGLTFTRPAGPIVTVQTEWPATMAWICPMVFVRHLPITLLVNDCPRVGQSAFSERVVVLSSMVDNGPPPKQVPPLGPSLIAPSAAAWMPQTLPRSRAVRCWLYSIRGAQKAFGCLYGRAESRWQQTSARRHHDRHPPTRPEWRG